MSRIKAFNLNIKLHYVTKLHKYRSNTNALLHPHEQLHKIVLCALLVAMAYNNALFSTLHFT